MSNRIFATHAPMLWAAGYSAIPCKKEAKSPLIKNQYSYADNIPSADRQVEWLRKYPEGNIAVVMGTKLPDGTILGALDVDDDRYSSFVGSILGYCPAIKRSPRGLTYFVRFPAAFKKSVIKDHNGKSVCDILAKSSYVIIPPSIHPDGPEYKWAGAKPLWECKYEELPYVE